MATDIAHVQAAGTRHLSQRKRPLAPIQTNLVPDSLTQLPRPPPVETVVLDKRRAAPPAADSARPADARLSRRASRNFLGLFAKKSPIRDARPRTSPTPAAGQAASPIKSATPALPSPSTPKTRSPTKETGPRKKEKAAASPRQSAHWDPPPLFQAYPQALKHAPLLAPALPAAVVLRNRKRADEARRAAEGGVPGVDETSSGGGGARPAVIKKKAATAAAAAASDAPVACADKIFVLATSGWLLQYAAAGAHDRRPERLLRLGRASAAFASDALPGRHWVLQVHATAATDDSSTAGGSGNSGSTGGVSSSSSGLPGRSVFARLAGRRVRREVDALLLVMPAADALDAWLVSIRRLIQRLGGQAYSPDVRLPGGAPAPADVVQRLQARPSRRFVIKRDLSVEQAAEPATDAPGDASGARAATMSSTTTERRGGLPLRQPTSSTINRPAYATAQPPRPPPSVASLDSDGGSSSVATAVPALSRSSDATASTARSSLISTAGAPLSKRASRVEPLQPYAPIIAQKQPPPFAPGPLALPDALKGIRPLSFPAAVHGPTVPEAGSGVALPNFSVPFSSHRFSQTYKPAPALGAPASNTNDAPASTAAVPTAGSLTVSTDATTPGPAQAAADPLPDITPVTPTARAAGHPDRNSSLDHAYGLLPWAGADAPPADDENTALPDDAAMADDEALAAEETALAWDAAPAPAPAALTRGPAAPAQNTAARRPRSLGKRHSAYDLPAPPPRPQPRAPSDADLSRGARLGPLPALPPHATSAPAGVSPPKTLRRPTSMQVRPQTSAASRGPAVPLAASRLPKAERSNGALRPLSVPDGAGAAGEQRPRTAKAARAAAWALPTPPPPRQPLPEIPAGMPLAT